MTTALSTPIAADAIDLVGMWRLVSATTWRNGELRDPQALGPQAGGYINYVSEGRMMVVLDRGSQAQFGEQYGSEPIFAYAGRYTRRGGVVLHHLEMCTRAEHVGTDYVREIEVAGDHLVLCTEPLRRGENVYVSKLEWERVTS